MDTTCLFVVLLVSLLLVYSLLDGGLLFIDFLRYWFDVLALFVIVGAWLIGLIWVVWVSLIVLLYWLFAVDVTYCWGFI